MTIILGYPYIYSGMTLTGDILNAMEVQPTQNGKAESITVYLRVQGTLNAAVRCMIYDQAYNLLGTTEMINVPQTVGRWVTFCFTNDPNIGTDPDSLFPDGFETEGPNMVIGQRYYLTVWAENLGVVIMFMGNAPPNTSFDEPFPFFIMPPPVLIPINWYACKYSLYATLTVTNDSSADLPCEFVVPQWQEDLFCHFFCGKVPLFSDLKAKFYVKVYRGPEDISANTWGAILVIDPERQRTVPPIGPLYLLLDNMRIKPGLTETAGAFHAEINDNGCDDPASKIGSIYVYDRHIPYWIFKDWVRKNDEFWIGVQRGPGNDPWEPEPASLTWDPTGGSDGKGSGRVWLMGGFINNPYYSVDADKRITAAVEGKCHMDVWKDQLFGTPTIPRNYSSIATDLKTIAIDLLADVAEMVGFGIVTSTGLVTATITIVNYAACVDEVVVLNIDGSITILTEGIDWNRGASNSAAAASLAAAIDALTGVSASPDGAIVSIIEESHLRALGASTSAMSVAPPSHNYRRHLNWFTLAPIGITWQKEFKQEAANNVMGDICSESSYEWRIDYKKRVLLYPRGLALLGVTSPDIDFTKIRNLPEIVMDDTTEQITHVISTDASSVTVPSDIDLWCILDGHWPDMSNPNRVYIAAMPFPPNPSTRAISDSTLVFDDEGHPALCFMKDNIGRFQPNLCLTYDDATGDWIFSRLRLDLRIWRRVKFKFRHVTRVSATGNEYLVRIHTALNDFYKYDFTSLVTDNQWAEILDIELPELNEAGVVIDSKDWEEHDAGSLDPTEINYLEFQITCGETTSTPPPYEGFDLTLAGAYNPAVDKDSCNIADAQKLAGYPATMIDPVEFFRPQFVLFEPGAGVEEARIKGINISGLPGGNNVQLERVLNNAHAGGSTVRLRMGWAISLSQIHFERNIRVEREGAGIQPPYRYRMMISKEMNTLQEASDKADAVLNEELESRQYVRANIDGDPRFVIGYRTRVDLPMDPFANVYMIIDDIEYRLGPDVDFIIEATVGLLGKKARRLNELSIIEAHERRLYNLGLGKTELP